MIGSKLEHAEVIWSPHKYVLKLERIVTKKSPELKDLTYEQRLKDM